MGAGVEERYLSTSFNSEFETPVEQSLGCLRMLLVAGDKIVFFHKIHKPRRDLPHNLKFIESVETQFQLMKVAYLNNYF